MTRRARSEQIIPGAPFRASAAVAQVRCFCAVKVGLCGDGEPDGGAGAEVGGEGVPGGTEQTGEPEDGDHGVEAGEGEGEDCCSADSRVGEVGVWGSGGVVVDRVKALNPWGGTGEIGR